MLAAAAIGAMAAPALAQQSGPVATYWVSAATSTGMGGMMGQMGAGGATSGADQQQQQAQPKPKRPGLGSMLGAAASGMIPGAGMFGGHGGGDSTGGNNGGGGNGGASGYAAMMQGGGAPVRTLSLQLGSVDKASGDPTAEHLIPTGLNMGPSLPLVTPVAPPPAKSEEGDYTPPQMQHPQGKLMIYWGCGEHAAAAPIVIDFATVAQGQMPKLPTVEVHSEHPPSQGRAATYGSWPNMKDSQRVPQDASLVGDHMVRGDYSPDIHFHLDENHDFMGPLTVNQEPTPGGATRLTWAPVQGATGYYAWLMGMPGGRGGGGDGKTMVMWTSGMTASAFSALLDYLPPAEVRRLVAQQVVMAPSTTECIVPEEVRGASAMGLLSMIAYGDEANFADPPRPTKAKAPWNLKYVVKVRFKSTTSLLLGMDMGGRHGG
jgi:hypothetical protein